MERKMFVIRKCAIGSLGVKLSEDRSKRAIALRYVIRGMFHDLRLKYMMGDLPPSNEHWMRRAMERVSDQAIDDYTEALQRGLDRDDSVNDCAG
jgi:hypothetical protein